MCVGNPDLRPLESIAETQLQRGRQLSADQTLVVREDSSNNPTPMFSKALVTLNKAGEVIQTAIKPGARVRVYYANMGDSRVVNHVVVLLSLRGRPRVGAEGSLRAGALPPVIN